MRVFLIYLALLLVSCQTAPNNANNSAPMATTSLPTTSLSADQQTEDIFAVFEPSSAVSRYQLDHQPWSTFLRSAVYVTGRSNRVPARRDDNTRQSGTKLQTGSRSRYRYEGNRVLFHLFNDGAIEYVAVYRQALQDTMGRIAYGDLSRNEQLAFWLNLHNAVLIHEIAKAHPISRPQTYRIRDKGNQKLFEAKLVEVEGVKLSLNDIRYNIIYRYWRNPYVMYGLWDGAISGPNISSIAYSGSTILPQLESNGKEFVNSLRGVDRQRGEMRISENYFKARPYFFPNWPTDLYDHLARYAVGEAADIVATRPENLRANRYDGSTADVESGETIRMVGNDNPGALAGQDLGGVFATLSSTAMRGGYTGEALALATRSEERKSRRVGSVIILDITTDDPNDAPERIRVEEENASEN